MTRIAPLFVTILEAADALRVGFDEVHQLTETQSLRFYDRDGVRQILYTSLVDYAEGLVSA